MKFLGIDLGWRSGASGLCCLSWQAGELQLIDIGIEKAIESIITWVETVVPPTEPAIIAVDAPTIIPNATGMRLADKLTHKHFGRYHAGSYPANLNRPFAQNTVGFGEALESRGFIHAPTIEPQKPGRYQIEVYPHPAMVNLFKLDRILKYKKGRLQERRVEISKLRQYIIEIMPILEPRLNLGKALKSSQRNPLFGEIPSTTATLKQLEDKLDSLICAYIAAYWWYWGKEKNWVLGDRSSGYIIVPGKP